MHRQILSLVTVCGVVVVASACSSFTQAHPTGSVEVIGAISSASQVQAGVTISSLSVTATACDGEGVGHPVTQSLVNQPNADAHGHWTGILSNLPVGKWKFHATASGSDGNGHSFTYTADDNGPSDHGVSISVASSTIVALNLQEDGGGGHDFSNDTPRIEALYVSTTEAAPGDTVTFTVTATDADDDALSFSWAVSDGADPVTGHDPVDVTKTCGAPDEDADTCVYVATWLAPDVGTDLADEENYYFTVTANDGKDGKASITVSVRDAYANSRATQEIDATINTWPVVQGIAVSGNNDQPLAIHSGTGDHVALDLSAFDPDGDALSYSWSVDDSNCIGSFTVGGGPPTSIDDDVTFTLTDVVTGATTCKLKVVVSEGKGAVHGGASNTGYVTLQLGAPAEADNAPVIDTTFQSITAIDPTDLALGVVSLSLSAHDPDAGGVVSSVVWSVTGDAQGATVTAGDGCNGTCASPAHSATSAVTFTPTVCPASGSPIKITATVTSHPEGDATATQSSSVEFDLTAAQGCHVVTVDHPPTVTELSIPPYLINPGAHEAPLLSVTAADSDDGDVVSSVVWTVTPNDGHHYADSIVPQDGCNGVCSPAASSVSSSVIFGADVCPGGLSTVTVTVTVTSHPAGNASDTKTASHDFAIEADTPCVIVQ